MLDYFVLGTPLLGMKAYPVDSSPLGFIFPPIEQVVQYEKFPIPYPLSSSRCFGLQGVAWPTSLYPLLLIWDGSVDDSLRILLPHDFLFLEFWIALSPGRLWDSCSQLGVFSNPRFSAFSPAFCIWVVIPDTGETSHSCHQEGRSMLFLLHKKARVW